MPLRLQRLCSGKTMVLILHVDLISCRYFLYVCACYRSSYSLLDRYSAGWLKLLVTCTLEGVEFKNPRGIWRKWSINQLKIMQISMATNHGTFQTCQKHYPERETRLTTPLHRRVSLRFFWGQGRRGLFTDYNTYLVADNQFGANQFYITASANQKWDLLSRDGEVWGSKSSLGSVSLNFTSGSCFRGSVLGSSNPPVTLLTRRLSSVPSSGVVTIGRLVVKHSSSLLPVINSTFKVELACFRKENK